MDELRAAGAPLLGQYVDQTLAASALRSAPPRTARGRTALRWVGIASCVLAVCMLLLVGWLTWPQPAQLLGRWLASEQSRGAARAEAVLSPGSPPAAERPASNG